MVNVMKNKEKEEQRQRKLEENEKHAAFVNSRIIPETPGYVRHDGPRRQYRAEVIDGRLVYTEI